MQNVITQREYKTLVQRQERVEAELQGVKRLLKEASDDFLFQPGALKRWERISIDLDNKKGRHFGSVKEMRHWLKHLS